MALHRRVSGRADRRGALTAEAEIPIVHCHPNTVVKLHSLLLAVDLTQLGTVFLQLTYRRFGRARLGSMVCLSA
jgi:hypothetical protein